MELNTMDEILIAIYIESRKDLPNMNMLVETFDNVYDEDILNAAYIKIERQGLVNTGVIDVAADNHVEISVDVLYPSSSGIIYAEKLLDIKADDTNNTKVNKIKTFLTQGVSDIFKAVITDILLKNI